MALLLERHEFDMALTRADFMRLLPAAIDPLFNDAGNTISGESGNVVWLIQLQALPPRKIALLEVPRLEVKLALQSITQSALDEWLRRFHLGFQRAGG